MTNSSPLAPFLRAAAGHFALNLGLSFQALIRYIPRCYEHSQTLAATRPTLHLASRSCSRVWGPNHFFLCLQYLSLHLQPWVVSGTADLGRRRRRTQEKRQRASVHAQIW